MIFLKFFLDLLHDRKYYLTRKNNAYFTFIFLFQTNKLNYLYPVHFNTEVCYPGRILTFFQNV